ncbi:MAG: prepilin peptidase [Moorellaceae bacterium]
MIAGAAFTFLLGLCIGSYLNVVIYRLPRGENTVSGRSQCPRCGRILAWYDLIPLLSYLILGGRCRYCGERISFRYPLVEFLTGAVFTALFYRLGPSPVLLKYLVLACILISAAFIDVEHYLIPDRLIFTALIAGAGFLLTDMEINITLALLGALSAGGLLLFLALVSRGNVGGGDVKLATVIGWYLGWPWGLLAVVLGLLLAGMVGLFLLVLRLKSRKDLLPLGPFLAAGALATVFWGSRLLHWYLSRFWLW